MKKWIRFPRMEGETSRQAHADLPAMTYERELGKEGFFGPATHMFHPRPPTDWVRFEGPLRPRAFDTTKIHTGDRLPWFAKELFSNASTRICFWLMPESMNHLARNSDGDELIFIHEGEGDLYCDYGHLSISEGDYVMIPRGTMWRIDSHSPIKALLIEATNDSYFLPEKGILGDHAIFDPAVLEVPKLNEQFKAQKSDEETEVVVKRNNQVSTIVYPYNPLDAIGWHGDLLPVKLNWRDIRPLMSHRYHLPPSVHTTFLSKRFVVCTFVPRPFETDEGAIKVPFYHNNDDFDELIFYHQGEFFSRDNIHPGMMTMHPCGFTHGPHPKALEGMLKQKEPGTNEVAVMIDTRDALNITEQANELEWKGYVNTWKRD